MSHISVVPADLSAAASTVGGLADDVRRDHGTDAISGAAAAIAGSTSRTMLTGMGLDWEADATDLANDLAAFADSLEALPPT